MARIKDTRRKDRDRYVGKQLTKAEREASQSSISMQRAISCVFRDGKQIRGAGQ